MTKHKESLRALEELLGKIQTDLNRARMLVHQIVEGKESAQKPGGVHSTFDAIISDLVPKAAPENNEVQVIEGVFDGYFMFGSDKKKYPVPLNYSSKTKLIPGDVLKLRIMEDGKLIYKLIAQAPRKFIKATLSKTDDNKFTAISDEGIIFYLNQAAVTYFKGQTGDELAIIINGDNIGDSAAIEALIPRHGTFNEGIIESTHPLNSTLTTGNTMTNAIDTNEITDAYADADAYTDAITDADTSKKHSHKKDKESKLHHHKNENESTPKPTPKISPKPTPKPSPKPTPKTSPKSTRKTPLRNAPKK